MTILYRLYLTAVFGNMAFSYENKTLIKFIKVLLKSAVDFIFFTDEKAFWKFWVASPADAENDQMYVPEDAGKNR